MKRNLSNPDLLSLKEELIAEMKLLLTTDRLSTEFLKNEDVKKILGCSDSKLHTIREKKLLPFSKVLGTYYYRVQDLRQLFEDGMVE